MWSVMKIPHVNVTDIISTLILPVSIHEDGAIVILVYDVHFYSETLDP